MIYKAHARAKDNRNWAACKKTSNQLDALAILPAHATECQFLLY